MEIDVRDVESEEVDSIRFADDGIILFREGNWSLKHDDGGPYTFSFEKENRDEEIDNLIKALHYLKREVN